MGNSSSQSKKKKNNFIVQGSILAIAGIIVRLIGMIRRIPLTNIITDIGNGYYSAAFEIYSIILLISSYSLPLAVSKLVSARVGKGQYRNANKIFRGALAFAMVSGGIAGVFVFFFSDFLAGTVMLEPMSALALKTLAPTLFIVAIMGVFRGYFQGLGTMMPTAVSQILEQVMGVIITLIAASVMFNYGSKVGALLQNENYGPSYGAAGGTVGVGVGAFFALLFLFFVFAAYKKIFRKQIAKDATRMEETYAQIFRVLVLTIVPVVLSTAVYNVSTVIDQRIYNQVMIAKGMEDIKSFNWGVFSGKYRVLTNVPIALANAMCASAIPTLTAVMSNGEHKKAKEQISKVIRFTMLITIPCAVGLAVLGRPIVDMLFSGEIDLAANMLHIGTISVIFYSLSTLTNGILQGINRMKIPVRNAFIALCIHIGALYVMLQYLDLNIYAVVYANILFSFLMCVLNNLAIRKHLKYKQEWLKSFVIPGIAAGVMGLIIFLLYKALYTLIGNMTATMIAIFVGAMVYFILLVALKGVSEDELAAMPCGRVLVKAARGMHIL